MDNGLLNRDQMILDHVAMVRPLIKSWCRRFNRYRSEIISETYLSIIKSVDRVCAGDVKHKEYTAYILKSAQGAIMTFLRGTQRRPENRVTTISINAVEDEDKLTGTEDKHDLLAQLMASEIFQLIELNSRDREIINLEIAGHTCQEIGDKMNLSRQRISQLTHNIHGRVRAFYG